LTLGLLDGVIVSIVHTESPQLIRVISFRKATKREQTIIFDSIKADWSRVRTMKDRDIQRTKDHPEADMRHIVRGVVRRGLKPVPPKAAISLRLDADVLDWFKAQGPGYQTRINAVLRAYKDEAA
jgi:uncharacterized protein (DUF4415 family)